MKKAYAYMLDALFALVIFGLMLGAAVSLNQIKEVDTIKTFNLTKIGQDALFVLDEKEILSTFEAELVDESLNEIMPENIDWRIEVERFVFNGATFSSNNKFIVESDFNTTRDVEVKRIFFDVNGNTIQYYYIADLKLGLK